MAGVAVLVLGGVAVGAGYIDSSYVTEVGWTQDQPVPFSHQHHAGDLGIDCRYCHANVETSTSAGLPATQVCMTCHSQLWTQADMLEPVRASYATGRPIHWRRVAQLPDYVYFDHAIHIDRGVACVECHGRVDRMPLMYRAKALQMQFCLGCHRDPAERLRPPDQVTRMDWSEWSSEDAKSYGASAVKHFRIDATELDNCGICHR